MPYDYPCRRSPIQQPMAHCAPCQRSDSNAIISQHWRGSSEPSILYSLFFSAHAVTEWSTFLRHWQPTLLYAGIFVHQRPYCEFNHHGTPAITLQGSHACRCELGDLLVVFTDTPAQRRVACLFQAKMAGGAWPPSFPNPDQWELYTRWPTFRYTPRSRTSNPGARRRTLPFAGSQDPSGQYLQLDPTLSAVATTYATAAPSYSAWDQTLNRVLNGGAGRDFSWTQSRASNEWDELIWDLLDYTANAAMPSGVSGSAGGNRGVGAWLMQPTMIDATNGNGPGDRPPPTSEDGWGIPVIYIVRENR